jgi:hypothetical protein
MHLGVVIVVDCGGRGGGSGGGGDGGLLGSCHIYKIIKFIISTH